MTLEIVSGEKDGHKRKCRRRMGGWAEKRAGRMLLRIAPLGSTDEQNSVRRNACQNGYHNQRCNMLRLLRQTM